MKVFIWFLCFLLNSVITVLINMKGVLLGGIPTAALFYLTWILAKILCKKWDIYQQEKQKNIVEKSKVLHGSRKGYKKYFPILLSVISCLCTLFQEIFCLQNGVPNFFWICGFVLYCIPLCIFIVNIKKSNSILNLVNFIVLVCFFWLLSYMFFEEEYIDEIAYIIALVVLFCSTLIQLIFSILYIIKMHLNKYYDTFVYREKCYKKVDKIKEYYEKGIISKEEFEKNKKDILKNIKI